jgi:hypothetical protein
MPGLALWLNSENYGHLSKMAILTLISSLGDQRNPIGIIDGTIMVSLVMILANFHPGLAEEAIAPNGNGFGVHK